MDEKLTDQGPNGTQVKSAGEDMADVAALLREIREEEERQRKYMKKHLRFLQFCALVMAAVLVMAGVGVASFVPKLNDLVAQTDTALQNINAVTKELAQADITGMLDDVDRLVVSGQDNMNRAAEKIMSIDIESLNGAISDLKAVIEPLANFFGKLR